VVIDNQKIKKFIAIGTLTISKKLILFPRKFLDFLLLPQTCRQRRRVSSPASVIPRRLEVVAAPLLPSPAASLPALSHQQLPVKVHQEKMMPLPHRLPWLHQQLPIKVCHQEMSPLSSQPHHPMPRFLPKLLLKHQRPCQTMPMLPHPMSWLLPKLPLKHQWPCQSNVNAPAFD